jgi:beta-glucosidase
MKTTNIEELLDEMTLEEQVSLLTGADFWTTVPIPRLLPWLDAVPAVLQFWYPGQECGNVIADVLLGVADPGGRLPQTWPLRIEDAVAFGDARQYPGVDGHVTYGEGLSIGYRHHEAHGITPQFAFGHGLSFSAFAHDGLALDRYTLQPGEKLIVTLTVCNTGMRAGSEVVQLYPAR